MTDVQPRLPEVDEVRELQAVIERLKADVQGQQAINVSLKRENMRLINAAKNERSQGPLTATVRRIFERWIRRLDKNPKRTLLTDDRFDKIGARLREGRSEADTNFIIDVLPHIAFTDQKGQRYDDIEIVCRSGSNWEMYFEKAERHVHGGVMPIKVGERKLPRNITLALNHLEDDELLILDGHVLKYFERCDCGHIFSQHSEGCTVCDCLGFDTLDRTMRKYLKRTVGYDERRTIERLAA